MANKTLFSNDVTRRVPEADTVNDAGGVAYKSPKRRALAQIAATNCFNGTYYASANDNLEVAKKAALDLKNDPEFIAKTVLYSRNKNHMKDMPAFLCVVLADTDTKLFQRVFPQVITNGKMLRNFCQMARSGAVTGRVFNLSSGTCRRAIQNWFDSRSPRALFKASIGNNPSMADILKMARPKPNSPEKEALFGYFLGKEVPFEKLPEIVQQYETYKNTKEGTVPQVDFRMLDSLGIGDKEWAEIARNAPWMMTRMNLNTFARHNVFKNSEVAQIVADRLRNEEEIKKAKQFPYQLMTAYMATQSNSDVPHNVREALQDAMEISIDNVPSINGKIFVCVDTSGSMGMTVTGNYGHSVVRCSDVAGLIASSIFRNNPTADILTFDSTAVKVHLNPRDTVITNAKKLSSAGGGTDCSAGLRTLNKEQAEGDMVIYVSDNESWLDKRGFYWQSRGTGMQSEWEKFRKRNPQSKLVCIDLTPTNNSQVKERENVLQVGGFGDEVFNILASFAESGNSADYWSDEIDKISLD